MSLILCEKCSLHYLKTEGQCPHCTSSKRGTASTSMLTAVLLGLSLTACGDKERDADSDGYGDSVATSPIVAGTDCNDANTTIHPGATDPAKDCAE